VDLGTGGVGEELGAEADAEDGAVGGDGALEEGDFLGEEGVIGFADVGDAHRAAEDDQGADFVEVGGDFVAGVEFALVEFDAVIAKDGDDSAGAFVGDVLEDDDVAHWWGSLGEGGRGVIGGKGRREMRRRLTTESRENTEEVTEKY
jgi:hypothetical protein